MEDLLDYISQAIYQNSYVVVDDFVDESYRKALLKEQTDLLNQGQFKKAAVGKGDQKQVRAEIRSDEVLWMDPTALSPLQVVFWDQICGNFFGQRWFLEIFACSSGISTVI